jgi:hypothetical protein
MFMGLRQAGWLPARKTHQEILHRKQWNILKEWKEVKCEFVVISGQLTDNCLGIERLLPALERHISV